MTFVITIEDEEILDEAEMQSTTPEDVIETALEDAGLATAKVRRTP